MSAGTLSLFSSTRTLLHASTPSQIGMSEGNLFIVDPGRNEEKLTMVEQRSTEIPRLMGFPLCFTVKTITRSHNGLLTSYSFLAVGRSHDLQIKALQLLDQ